MTGGRKPPFDPRLLSRVPAARGHLAALAVLGGGTAAIIVTQATALAALLAGAAEGRVEVAALAAFAAALALFDEQRVYGRYWGTLRHIPCLHFEASYYQLIEFSIA